MATPDYVTIYNPATDRTAELDLNAPIEARHAVLESLVESPMRFLWRKLCGLFKFRERARLRKRFETTQRNHEDRGSQGTTVVNPVNGREVRIFFDDPPELTNYALSTLLDPPEAIVWTSLKRLLQFSKSAGQR